MSKRLQIFLLFTVLLVVALGLALYFASEAARNGASFDHSGTQITPDIIKRCPGYVQTGGGRIIRVSNDEGMNGGMMMIQLELSGDQLATFLADSPFRDGRLDSKFVPSGFDSWLPPGRFNEMGRSRAFSTGSVSIGRTKDTILIDRTIRDILVIYIQSIS
jgi:hypothetical protein